jgi:transcriptional regulator with XRE-family HTH domain
MTRPLRGKIAQPLSLIEVIPLTSADLATLHKPRSRSIAQRFREPHHLIARLLAQGMQQQEVAKLVGYSVTRVSQLEADPAFQNLLAVYRERVTEKIEETFDHYLELKAHNMIRAERTISDHFDKAEDENELVPLKTALLVAADGADRLGYGKRQMNVNVNVDFAAELEKARSRVGRMINVPKGVGSASNSPAPEPSSPQSAHAPAQGSPFRRLA